MASSDYTPQLFFHWRLQKNIIKKSTTTEAIITNEKIIITIIVVVDCTIKSFISTNIITALIVKIRLHTI